MQFWHEQYLMLDRFILKENLYVEMDYPSRLRRRLSRVRHPRWWLDFRLIFRHGLRRGFRQWHRLDAEQLWIIRQLWLGRIR